MDEIKEELEKEFKSCICEYHIGCLNQHEKTLQFVKEKILETAVGNIFYNDNLSALHKVVEIKLKLLSALGLEEIDNLSHQVKIGKQEPIVDVPLRASASAPVEGQKDEGLNIHLRAVVQTDTTGKKTQPDSQERPIKLLCECGHHWCRHHKWKENPTRERCYEGSKYNECPCKTFKLKKSGVVR